jgi:hypothetical protein
LVLRECRLADECVDILCTQDFAHLTTLDLRNNSSLSVAAKGRLSDYWGGRVTT